MENTGFKFESRIFYLYARHEHCLTGASPE